MTSKVHTAVLLVGLMVLGPLAGCMSEEAPEAIEADAVLTIDGRPASEATIEAGAWHDLILIGDGLRISAPADDVLLFVNGSLDIDSSVPVDGDRVSLRLLTTPYAEEVLLVMYDAQGRSSTLDIPVVNGTPIVSGAEWFEKMEYILCDVPSDDCGAYKMRWMGAGNGQFERAAIYFQGHFDGLGYDTHIMRVNDHLNPTQPESLNVIAWKQGRSSDCVQGMGAHMDIPAPRWPRRRNRRSVRQHGRDGDDDALRSSPCRPRSGVRHLPRAVVVGGRGCAAQTPLQTTSAMLACHTTRN